MEYLFILCSLSITSFTILFGTGIKYRDAITNNIHAITIKNVSSNPSEYSSGSKHNIIPNPKHKGIYSKKLRFFYHFEINLKNI